MSWCLSFARCPTTFSVSSSAGVAGGQSSYRTVNVNIEAGSEREGGRGGPLAIGQDVHPDEDMSAAICAGFPHSAVEELLKSSGFSLQEIASMLDLSLRSLQRRKSQGRLARYESDCLYRLRRLVLLAGYLLGDHQRALDWLKRPNLLLGGVTPRSIIDAESGAGQVEKLLRRIGYGGVS